VEQWNEENTLNLLNVTHTHTRTYRTHDQQRCLEQFLLAVYTSIPVADKRNTPCGYGILRLRLSICVCLRMYPCMRDVCVCLYAHTYWYTDMRVYLHVQVRNIYVYLIFMSTCRWKRLCHFELMRSLIGFMKYCVSSRTFSKAQSIAKLHTPPVLGEWVRMAYWWNTDRKNGIQLRKPAHCLYDYHKSSMDWCGRKQGSLGWKADS